MSSPPIAQVSLLRALKGMACLPTCSKGLLFPGQLCVRACIWGVFMLGPCLARTGGSLGHSGTRVL